MQNISIFKNHYKYQKDANFQEIFQRIQNGEFKSAVGKIRQKLEDGKDEEASNLKKALPAFTTSGSFLKGRQADLITTYSQCIILDIDKLDSSTLQTVKDKASLAPYTFCAFISPSGIGIKVIIQTNADLSQHAQAYVQLCEYYEKALEVTIDQSGKDVSRLCYFSYDPDIIIHPDALIFEVVPQPTAEELPLDKKPEPNESNWSKQFNEAIVFTEKIQTYQEGNRNNFIHLLACNCNRKGIPEADVSEFIKSRYDLSEAEIETSVKSAYKNNATEFAKDAKPANATNLQSDEDDNPTIDFLSETPIIPQSVYDTLPTILKTTAEAFDVYLTSAIVVLSGCLPNVSGIYGQEEVFPHLFSFVVAPPASGKGVLKNAKKLGDEIHNRLIAESTKAMEQFEKDRIRYELLKRNYKGEGEPPVKPIQPPFKLLFIPGDCSQARILELLKNNDGKAIICETEADTVSGANKQDWGNYSPVLRCAFHHEKVSVTRKTDNTLFEIATPKIAVALSGTPNQVAKLIASAEDGLFSRFIFYAFKSEILWQSPAPNPNKKTLNQLFEETSKRILQAHDFLTSYKTQVTLSDSQWAKLNSSFTGKLNNVALFTSEDAVSIVFRLGLMVFRFCLIFTALRKFDNGDLDEIIGCEEEDFNNAIILSDVYLAHSLLIYNNLSDKDKKPDYEIPDNKKRFLNALPDTVFQRKEAVAIGKQFDLSPRSVDSFLKNSTGSILICVKTGYYTKISQ